MNILFDILYLKLEIKVKYNDIVNVYGCINSTYSFIIKHTLHTLHALHTLHSYCHCQLLFILRALKSLSKNTKIYIIKKKV